MIMDEPRERDRNGLQARASVSSGSGVLNARDEWCAECMVTYWIGDFGGRGNRPCQWSEWVGVRL